MFSHEVHLRVCYADTDQMGYVYYGNYGRFYEIARMEALRSLGFSYKELEAAGTMMPVYENKSRYLRPARYDDLLTVKVVLRQPPAVRIVFEYEVYNEGRTLLNTGETTLVFVNRKSGRPGGAPAELIRMLQPFFAAREIPG
ncbi:MAG: acyl-CoA thioesterase [Ferruginibacter sp.]|nr:acyl-CoA thioesterase [Cytophagales bacterium]